MQYEFVKPSHLIHINHNLSRTQTQIWDFILAQSSPEDFVTKSEHTITIASILKYLGNTRNQTRLEKIIKQMGEISTYTILKKDSRLPARFKIFSSLAIESGVIHYVLSREMRNAIANPISYSRINLSMSLKFSGKYAHFLYQLCFDYEKIKKTPWFTLTQFCRYMNIDNDKYPEFSGLNYHVIKKAVDEVNRTSDIFVTPQYKKESRNILALRFKVTQKI